MIPDRVRRAAERLLPWYDLDEVARHNERSDYIHDRSIQVRVEAEGVIRVGRDRIRAAYALVGERLER